MNKVLVVLAGLSLMLTPQFAQAEEMMAAPVMEEAAAAVEATAEAAGEVAAEAMDNKICPISGQAIGSMGEPTEVEHNGKKVKLCCPHCIEAFNADPEAVMKKVDELAAAAAAEAAPAVEAAVETVPAAY